MSTARKSMDNFLKGERRTTEQRLARCPSLRPSSEEILDAFAEGVPEAQALIHAWQFRQPVRVVESLERRT